MMLAQAPIPPRERVRQLEEMQLVAHGREPDRIQR